MPASTTSSGNDSTPRAIPDDLRVVQEALQALYERLHQSGNPVPETIFFQSIAEIVSTRMSNNNSAWFTTELRLQDAPSYREWLEDHQYCNMQLAGVDEKARSTSEENDKDPLNLADMVDDLCDEPCEIPQTPEIDNYYRRILSDDPDAPYHDTSDAGLHTWNTGPTGYLPTTAKGHGASLSADPNDINMSAGLLRPRANTTSGQLYTKQISDFNHVQGIRSTSSPAGSAGMAMPVEPGARKVMQFADPDAEVMRREEERLAGLREVTRPHPQQDRFTRALMDASRSQKSN